MSLKKYIFIALSAIVGLVNAQEEERLTLKEGKKYIIGGVEVIGSQRYNPQTILVSSGLKVGEEIVIPSEKFSAIIHKLWGYKLFSDIDIYIQRVEGDKAFLELVIKEIPSLVTAKVTGVRTKKGETLLEDAKIKPGVKVTESLIADTKNYIITKYRKEGYFDTKVTIDTKVDTTDANGVNMLIHVDRGNKVKIANVNFEGNEKFSDATLRRKMKKTKQRLFGRFWKRSKYVAKEYDQDLVSLIDFYKENGYRDARITKDTVGYDADGKLQVNIALEEGRRYYFGDIRFLGNSIYSDHALHQVLGVKKGDVYNGVVLKKRVRDNSKPDSDDIYNLYQNSGYLFADVFPVETSVVNDTIDFELRIKEGKPAYFDKVTIKGNLRTNDHVVYRELRTRPGYLYNKDAVIRTVRELGQLGIFDAQNISPNIKNPDEIQGTVDLEYDLTESGGSQVQLQGGYGGGSFIGTLILSFNNFSVRKLFDKDAYMQKMPLPMGDGQSLSINLQASRFYRTYGFSFMEPWLGGKQPVQFSLSFNRTEQFGYDYRTYDVDKSRRVYITGINLGIAKRLRVPDDYFQISHLFSFNNYDLKNYSLGLFSFQEGNSNAFSYTISLSRNSSGPNPIYPMTGSNFSVSAKITPPYSIFNGVDYAALASQRVNAFANGDMAAVAAIDQERFRWLEYYKLKASGTWYTNIVDKFVVKLGTEFGYLGAYNKDRGIVPFERFFMGGDGLGYYNMDGRENIQMRGYTNYSLSSDGGDNIYNKFSLELRYPITLKPMASIYGLAFAEGGNTYTGFSNFNPFQLKRSAGLGLRLFMPMFGMLGIDFGYGFDKPLGSNTVGGWQTHFIFGQQF
ncbi:MULTISPECIES: BamA/OMP85 family outer membrane protein [Capnocytophaga]|uniref:BamA/OMP85 family outer membrane protein n=1 Tax=Capnocytophaga TaxID=1016 RepID=UPI000BB17ED7|nr:MULTISPECIES: POTRA domain-containing protein [Capnocytophaga]ATA73810.1 outer membrane protein assembly factor BamA [Capnocytophaga sp. H4358]